MPVRSAASIFSVTLAALLGACDPSACRADEADDVARTERMETMRRRAGDLVVRLGPTKTSERLKPNAEALLRFGDATRSFHDGTLWAFCDDGRPCLLISIERYEKFWSYELISLTDRTLVAKVEDWTWQPQNSPVKFQPVTKADPPAKTAEACARQARVLSHRFTAVEFLGDEQDRIELQLKPRPILTYESARQGVVSGSLFVLSNGTNPEALLILEAAKTDDGERWQYAFARISTAALEAALDSQRVWQADRSQAERNQTGYSYLGVPADDNLSENP